jgi:hypothetical protein
MADAEDLKSSGDFSSCGFDSHPGHHFQPVFTRVLVNRRSGGRDAPGGGLLHFARRLRPGERRLGARSAPVTATLPWRSSSLTM